MTIHWEITVTLVTPPPCISTLKKYVLFKLFFNQHMFDYKFQYWKKVLNMVFHSIPKFCDWSCYLCQNDVRKPLRNNPKTWILDHRACKVWQAVRNNPKTWILDHRACKVWQAVVNEPPPPPGALPLLEHFQNVCHENNRKAKSRNFSISSSHYHIYAIFFSEYVYLRVTNMILKN